MRMLPDGSVRKAKPFHISFEGMTTALLCKTEDDYGCFVKYIFICAQRNNLIVVVYTVVSNHAHILALSSDKDSCFRFCDDLKRIYGMYFTKKYREASPMAGNRALPLEITSDKYLRNVMAYILRNAEDNGGQISEYPWSSISAYFLGKDGYAGGRKVCVMPTREAKMLFRTNMQLKHLPWQVDGNGDLIPASACDHRYLEDAFFYDEAFFLRLLGSVNVSEMQETLVVAPRVRLRDNEFLREAENLCQDWFHSRLADINREKKIRLIVHMDRTRRCGIPQLARIFRMEREEIARLLDHGTRRKGSSDEDLSGIAEKPGEIGKPGILGDLGQAKVP